MPPTPSPWLSDVPLRKLALWADWDEVTSMIESLRLHAFEHGTVPLWNVMFCGGRPELAVPYSWAYTWPSLFAYALPPLHAVLLVWLAMSALGFAATRALLLRFGGSRLGATVGALTFVACGIFASRFSAGHVSFAFHHLVPVLMWLFDRAASRALAGERIAGAAAALALGSFAFASAALPHPLLQFYPAFLLFVALRVAQAVRERGAGAALRALWPLLALHALGSAAAAYKLAPVVAWQLAFPHAGVEPERYTLLQVMRGALDFVPDYFRQGQWESWHRYPAWEYNTYTGPLPWALFALAIGVAVLGRDAASRAGAALAGALVALGLWISLGNEHPLGLARLFQYVPSLDGVRVFPRYMVLTSFGLAIGVAQAFAWIELRCAGRRWRNLLLGALALATAGPVLAQFDFLANRMRFETRESIPGRYGLEQRPPVPLQVNAHYSGPWGVGHQTALLERGYWVANCYSPLTLPPPAPGPEDERALPLSWPSPSAIELHASTVVFEYAAGTEGPVRLNLRVPPRFSTEPATSATDGSHRIVEVDASKLPGRRLTLRTEVPGARRGAIVGALTALAAVCLVAVLHRRERAARTAAS